MVQRTKQGQAPSAALDAPQSLAAPIPTPDLTVLAKRPQVSSAAPLVPSILAAPSCSVPQPSPYSALVQSLIAPPSTLVGCGHADPSTTQGWALPPSAPSALVLAVS